MNTSCTVSVPIQVRRCGAIAIVGRPNVGKSTLLNALIKQKISITSRKAQTTRHRITGVRTLGQNQFIFMDTPGFQTEHNKALNKSLNKTVVAAMHDVDLIFWVLEAGTFNLADAKVLHLLTDQTTLQRSIILVANKVDRIHDKVRILPWLHSMQERCNFAELFPMSAQSPKDSERLLSVCGPYLPQQDWIFEADMLTDRSERFLACEAVREKLFRLMGDELPYTCTVLVDRFEEETSARFHRFVRIEATILVDRANHKAMIIGERGERIKRIGSEARQSLEHLMQAKVHLALWVKVKTGWADNEAKLRSYGYGE